SIRCTLSRIHHYLFTLVWAAAKKSPPPIPASFFLEYKLFKLSLISFLNLSLSFSSFSTAAAILAVVGLLILGADFCFFAAAVSSVFASVGESWSEALRFFELVCWSFGSFLRECDFLVLCKAVMRAVRRAMSASSVGLMGM